LGRDALVAKKGDSHRVNRLSFVGGLRPEMKTAAKSEVGFATVL
jgi:hypothetical protein